MNRIPANQPTDVSHPRSTSEPTETTPHGVLRDHSFPTQTVIRTVLAIWLAACLCVFVARSIHWPQVNDPAQISYLCFLMDHGFAPYRYLIEMNMPGIYLTNWSVAHLLGAGSLAWRGFDLLLTAAAIAAMIFILRNHGWFYGFFAGSLFALFHGQDGPAQLGQRDFIVTVLFLCAYAFLFEAIRRDKSWLLFFFGLCAAATLTYKPQTLLLTLFLLAALCWRLQSQQKPFLSAALVSVVGMVVPVWLVCFFLLHQQALKAFIVTERTLLPYYATLDRHSVPTLLRLLLVNSIGALLIVAVAIALWQRSRWNWERTLLVAGILFGVASDLAQGKGFLYHRYPFAAFALLWAAIEFATAMHRPGLARKLAYGGIMYGAIIAGIFTLRASTRTWDPSYSNALQHDLVALGGSNLSGSVQCITMSPQCATSLYHLRLVQSTGLVYDYFLFGPSQSPAIEYVRQRFWNQYIANRPRVIILGRWLYPAGMDDYSKLNRWPAFRNYLNDHYALYAERSIIPPKRGLRGYGYRIYVLR